MGIYEERPDSPGMHWQQQERYSTVYDPSRDLSPNLPVTSSDTSSMGDVEHSNSSTVSSNSISSTNSTNHVGGTCNNNNNNTTTTNGGSCCGPCYDPSGVHHHAAPPSLSTPTGCRPASCGAPGYPPASSECPIDATTYRHPQHHQKPSSGCGEYASASQTPSPATTLSSPVLKTEDVVCAGCGLRIADRFYLLAVDRRWHAACLQCCQCRQTLDGEATCFAREGNIFCKKDYYRLFGMKRCARCQTAILSSELVMRARDLVFHVHCFTCVVCDVPLTKGDHFGLHQNLVHCKLHYELLLAEHSGSCVPFGAGPGVNYQQFPSPEFHASPIPLALSPDNVAKVQFYNGTSTRQKGRPRKRKPKDLESMTANLDLNADSYLDGPFGASGPSPGLGGTNGQPQRTKRMRTSFKHHQLRTMKSYFAINHNPDAKDLKQLSQKTGLPKRVLQVWFQNARAKWRRMMLKQEGKVPDKTPEGSLADLSQSSLEASYHGGSGLQPLPLSSEEQSPQYILGSNSPSSLECA